MRLPCRVMPDTASAAAGWVLPVPGPPISTTLCEVSVKLRLASSLISRAAVLEALKSKLSRSRCNGSLAMFIWWLTERMARSVCSSCRRCSSSHLVDAVFDSPCTVNSAQAVAMPCRRSSR